MYSEDSSTLSSGMDPVPMIILLDLDVRFLNLGGGSTTLLLFPPLDVFRFFNR